MLSTLLPLPILGFVIFLMVDSEKRFKDLKAAYPELAKEYERQYALLMTLLVILAIILIAAVIYGWMKDSPRTYNKVFRRFMDNKPAVAPVVVPMSGSEVSSNDD